VTPLGPQRQRPPVGPQSSNQGTIEGYVYWDTNAVQHNPPLVCSGLAVTVSVGTPPSGPTPTFEQFKPLGTYNNLTYMNNVGALGVCAYAIKQVPIGQDLQVQVSVTPSTFSPVVMPVTPPTANNPNGPIKIVSGKCNNLPPAVPSASTLGSHWWTCGDYAYNVNFVLQASGATQLISASGGSGALQPGSGGAQAAKNSGTGGAPLLNGPGRTTLLNGPGSTLSSTQPGPPGTTPQASSGAVPGNRGRSSPGFIDPNRPTYQSGGGSAQTLTNSDVIKMVKAGIPESVIVSSVQSATKQFDFSNDSCRALQQANVSSIIVVAMGDGSVRPCPEITGAGGVNGSGFTDPNRESITDVTNRGTSITPMPGSKGELNPQPLPPRTAAGTGTAAPGAKIPVTREQMLARLKKPSPGSRAALTPVKIASPKALKKLTNPRLAEQNASIIAALEQQRHAAETETSAMKASTRTIASAASARAPAITANLQGNALQGPGPQQIQSSGTLSSQITHAPFFNGIVLVCAQDPTPRIVAVNGGQGHGTIFTPEAKYNLYSIVGCSFGPSRAGNSAYISAGTSFKANLNIDYWGENGITAHLDPWLAGVLDHDDVTLVVSPATGQPIQQPGFKFYAARGMPRVPDKTPMEVPLAFNSIPQSGVKPSSVTDVQVGLDGLPSNATSAFPSFSFKGNPVAGWLFRYAYGHDDSGNFLRDFDPNSSAQTYDCWINGFVAQQAPQQIACSTYFIEKVNTWANNLWGPLGADQWNLPLRPEFAISSYDLYYEDTDPSQICGAWDDSSKDSGHVGNWDFNLTAPNQISVSWQLYWCFDQEAWPFNRLNAMRQSAYALAVWVWGPRCVDPFTDQPDTACMFTVKKRLGG